MAAFSAVKTRTSACLPFVLLLASSSPTAGCVNLTKPKKIQECESLPGGCVNNPTRPDAPVEPDLAPPSDLPLASEVPKGTEVPETSRPLSDAALESADTASRDVLPDNRASDPIPPSEDGTGRDLGTDLLAERITAPEPGAEPPPEPARERGAEPGPEPGKELGAELGPEPRQEPGPERRPEPGPEPPRDGGAGTNCPIFYGSSPPTGSTGHPPGPGNTNAFCVATCDDIAGWGCSNFDGRTVSVNGAAATSVCGGSVTKVNGYNVFKVSAGTSRDAIIYWWGTYATSCPVPDGGLF